MKMAFKQRLEVTAIHAIHVYGFHNWRVIILCKLCDIAGIK